MAFCPANTGRRKKKTAALDERLKRCYTIGTAAGFYRALALLVGGNMMSVMFLLFLLQVFQRLTKHECDDADAGYRKQKVRHGFHLPSV